MTFWDQMIGEVDLPDESKPLKVANTPRRTKGNHANQVQKTGRRFQVKKEAWISCKKTSGREQQAGTPKENGEELALEKKLQINSFKALRIYCGE